MKSVRTPDEFFNSAVRWQTELARLRTILRATELEESIKWGKPCYARGSANVVGIVDFKSYFGLWFFQGALLKDPAKVLVNAQEGRTRVMRQWRMTSARDINVKLIGLYLDEALALRESGVKVVKGKPKPIVIPAALRRALAADQQAAAAFKLLTPGRRREYVAYLCDAKTLATKERRIAKIIPMIAAGVGLNDKFR